MHIKYLFQQLENQAKNSGEGVAKNQQVDENIINNNDNNNGDNNKNNNNNNNENDNNKNNENNDKKEGNSGSVTSRKLMSLAENETPKITLNENENVKKIRVSEYPIVMYCFWWKDF